MGRRTRISRFLVQFKGRTPLIPVLGQVQTAATVTELLVPRRRDVVVVLAGLLAPRRGAVASVQRRRRRRSFGAVVRVGAASSVAVPIQAAAVACKWKMTVVNSAASLQSRRRILTGIESPVEVGVIVAIVSVVDAVAGRRHVIVVVALGLSGGVVQRRRRRRKVRVQRPRRTVIPVIAARRGGLLLLTGRRRCRLGVGRRPVVLGFGRRNWLVGRGFGWWGGFVVGLVRSEGHRVST